MVVLLAARAARLGNKDAIDAAIVSMLADPREVYILMLLILDFFFGEIITRSYGRNVIIKRF